MANYYLVFLITLVVTYITYFVFFYKKVKERGDIARFMKDNLVLSVSVALVLAILLELISTEFQLTSIFVFIVIGLIESNIFTPVIFKEEYTKTLKKASMYLAVASKLLVFTIIYFIVFYI